MYASSGDWKMEAITCRKIAKGQAKAKALVSTEPISFLGGVDPDTGVVVEKGHPLEGKSVAGTILVFPKGKGSTVGSYTIYRLKKNGKAPSGMINSSSEPIVAVGAIISDIPMVDMPEKPLETLIKDDDIVTVDGTNGKIILGE